LGGERQDQGDNYITGHSPDRAASHFNRWGVVLAGGDGTRLRSLVKLICGAFREKPSLEIARKLLFNRDSVWNTFVMVGRVKAFVAMLHAALPDLSTAFATATLWNGAETHIEQSNL